MWKKILLGLVLVMPNLVLADSELISVSGIYHEKGIVRSVENEKVEQSEGVMQKLEVEVLAGLDAGQIVSASNSWFGGMREFLVEEGDKVLLYVEMRHDGKIFSVRDYWRWDGILFWTLVFLGLVFWVARWKGLKGVLALGLSIGVIFGGFIPAVKMGIDPLVAVLGVAILVILMNVPLIHGWNKKSLVISVSTAGAVLMTIGLTLLVTYFLKIRGIGADESIYLTGGLAEWHSLPKLFSAGVVLGALGAVMDICVSIASGLWEMVNHKKAGFGKLFKSGMNIGGDVLGSMLNTLVFAYVGASLIMLLVISQGEFALMPLLNFSFIVEEIVRSLIGSFGLLFGIPLTAVMAGLVLAKKR